MPYGNEGIAYVKPLGKRISLLNYFIAAALVLIVLLLELFALDNTCYWGDDFAAYISEGIAIAEGRLAEQSKLNALMHPTPLPAEAIDGSLVYVWGYPLLLALVYTFVGFDRVDFSSIAYYKLPDIIALALTAGILYLFLRRKMGGGLSFTLSLLFCSCYELRVAAWALYSDVAFLFFAVLSLYLAEVFLDKHAQCTTVKLPLIYGVLLGAVLWFTYETRLNGISILFACALATVFYYIKRRRELDVKRALLLLVPYICFLLLKLISEAILAPATANTSDLAGVTFLTAWSNFKSYCGVLYEWLTRIFDSIITSRLNAYLSLHTSTSAGSNSMVDRICNGFNFICFCTAMLLTIVGVCTDGIKQNLHLTLFVIVYLVVVCMLPYNQGIRYIYPVLVLIPLYFGCALRRGGKVLSRLFKCKGSKLHFGVSVAVAAMICGLTLSSALNSIDSEHCDFEDTVRNDPMRSSGLYAYTPCAIETYNYIINNTSSDCLIGFIKPRALYLNTERLSVRIGRNGHTLDEVDYLLCRVADNSELLTDEWRGRFTQVFCNDEFTLYEKIE